MRTDDGSPKRTKVRTKKRQPTFAAGAVDAAVKAANAAKPKAGPPVPKARPLRPVSGTARAGTGASSSANVAKKPKAKAKPVRNLRDVTPGSGRAKTKGGGSPTLAVSNLAAKVAPLEAALFAPGTVATLHVIGGKTEKTAKKIASNAARDLIDIPASAVPSAYYLAKTARHDPVKAGKLLAQPYVDLVKHPGRSLVEHPVGSALLVGGAEGAVGRGVGSALRHAPSETLRRVGSTAREPLTLPGGATRKIERYYSKDVIRKGVQVAKDKRSARKAVARGGKPNEASPKQIGRLVSEDVQAAKNITAKRQRDIEIDARKAVGDRARVKVRGGKPTAATTLAAQGITTAKAADLRAYMGELEAAAGKLTGESLRRNERARVLIADALKHHDEGRVQAAAEAYSKLAGRLDEQVRARGIVPAREAEATRLAGVKARRVGKGTRSPEIAAAKTARRAANRANERAIRARRAAQREFDVAKEAAQDAAKRNRGGVPPVQADRVRTAIDRLDSATSRVKETQAAAHDASMAFTRAHAPEGTVDPAYVSQAPGGDVRPAALPSKPPRVRVQQGRHGLAVKEGTFDVSPRRLVEQAVDTQRRVDAFDARNRFVADFAHRVDGVPVEFGRDAAGTAARRLRDKTGSEWEPVQTQTGGRYVLVPKAAAERLRAHEQQPAQNRVLRSATAQWRKNVLAFSPRWLTGNVLEAALRAVIAGAGPGSYKLARAALRRTDPAAAEQTVARAAGGGNFRTAQHVADDSALAGDLAGTARALHRFAQAPSAVGLGQLYRAVTGAVFSFNGAVENAFQTAMLGKAIRQHPLMDHRIIRVSGKAAEEAARGLRNTETQVQLGRMVDDMYGRYQKFGPDLRNAISTYTPFAAWAINATKFLYVVLPRDHPVLTSLLASANQASKEWRLEHGLVADPTGGTKGMVPSWLLGSIPTGGGGHQRAPSRYTPFAVMANDSTSPLGVIPSMLMPQLSEAMQNLQGKNWQGKTLSENPSAARDTLAAAVSLLMGQVPLASHAATISGARLPNMPDTQKIDPSVKVRVRKTLDPFMSTPGKQGVGASGALPPGVSQREIDKLLRESTSAAPAVSQAEIDKLLKLQNGGR